MHSHFEPLYWALFMVVALYLNIYKRDLFWNLNTFLAWTSFLILVVYCLGVTPFVHFDKNAVDDQKTGFFFAYF